MRSAVIITALVASALADYAVTSSAAPTHTQSPSPPLPHPHHEECQCYDEYNQCRGAPGANMSYCASNYAQCLGYNPFDGSHDPEEVSKKCAEEQHRPHHNETRPVHPTQPPVISGGSGVTTLDVFGLLAAAIAALL
ncbi:hypothetical protein J3F83DRAFT_737489 [Trichoderma novae-zelandiae]